MREDYVRKMTAVIWLLLLSACGGVEQYPFKDLSDNMRDFYQTVLDDPSKIEKLFKSFTDKQESLCEDLNGKSIAAEIEEGLGLDLASHAGYIGEVQFGGDGVEFSIKFELKVTDAAVAQENINDLMVVFYDDDMNAAYAHHPLESEKSASANVENPYENGQVVKKSDSFRFEGPELLIIGDVSKIVIKKYNRMEKQRMIKDYKKKTKDIYRELKEKLRSIE